MYSLCLIVWLEVLEDTSLFYDTALSYCFGEKKKKNETFARGVDLVRSPTMASF